MDDFEDLPVETLAGERPAGAIGERLLIGLAGLALLGGLLIAAGNLLSGFLPEAALEPSATPGATESVEASATQRPTPTERPLRELSLIPGPPDLDFQDYEPSTLYWVEALRPLEVYESQLAAGEPIRRLEPGDVALAERQPLGPGTDDGWLFVYAPDPPGWIRIPDHAGNEMARLTPTEAAVFPSGVRSLAAGPNGFVAHGWQPTTGWEEGPPLTLSSADGEHWTPANDEFDTNGMAVSAAWGPSGWLAARTLQPVGPVRTFVWESATGGNWSPVGELNVPGESYVKQLVASDRGYLLAFGLGTPELSSLWYSPDGLVWQESLDPFASAPGSEYPEDSVTLAASPAGFLAWRVSGRQAVGAVAAFSRDGRTWTPIELAPGDSVSWTQLALVGESVVGVGRDTNTVTRAYESFVGDAGAQAIVLARAPHLDLAFQGAAVLTIVSDGETAYAFGYEREDRGDAVWRGDGRSWRRIAAPDGGFNEPVRVAAAGPAGLVAVGAQANGTFVEPVLWHLRSDGAWWPEATAALPRIPPIGPDDCPSVPDSAVEFVAVHASVAIECFGSRPLSFTAWSTDCDGCFAGGSPGARPAFWLSSPSRFFLLLPVEGGHDGIGGWKQAVPAPDLAWRDEYLGAWLRITGHYDDPAARYCGAAPPDPRGELYYPGRLAEESYCRQQFVVTKATAVDGPRS